MFMPDNGNHDGLEVETSRRNYMRGSAALLAGAAALSGVPAASAAGSNTEEQSKYDIVLNDGHVIDPKNNISGVYDVAVADGKIAKVASSIDSTLAAEYVDVSDLYVTPGLIDLHTHLYFGTHEGYSYGGGYDSVWPDNLTFPYCVTTAVDTGSPGWDTFDEYKENIIEEADTRVLAFVNIVGPGMRGEVEQDTSLMQPKQAAETAQRYDDHIVGFKAAHYAGPEFTATKRAIEADQIGERDLRVMVDYGAVEAQLERGVENPLDKLLNEIMRSGDILTHCYSDYSVENGDINPAIPEAHKRGVLFDVGHGGGSFQWSDAVPMVQAGILAETISTDLHATSRLAGMKNMNNVMSKFLRMGLSMEEVIKRCTWNPAQITGHTELGHLSEGAPADIAVLSMQHGEFGLVDASNYRRNAYRKLEGELTIKGGEVKYDLNGLTSPLWEPWEGDE
jgi:dihydroorotase